MFTLIEFEGKQNSLSPVGPVIKCLLSGLHTANLSRQTRVGKLKLVCVNGIKTVGKHISI